MPQPTHGRRAAASRRSRLSHPPAAYAPEALEGRRLLAFSAIGPEFPVNRSAAGHQTVPAVAADAAGNFVVAWTSANQAPDGSGQGVVARRYNAAGVPLGGEFLVNTYTAGDQVVPAVAADADGDFVVAWWNQDQGGAGSGIYAQRFDDAGARVGVEFRVNVNSVASDPALAMDVDGDFVVAWAGGTVGSLMYARRYDAAGTAQGGDIEVSNTPSLLKTPPCVAMDADGDFVIGWGAAYSDGYTVGPFDVFAKRYNAAGQEQVPPAGVPRGEGNEFRVNDTTAGDQSNPAAAAAYGGQFVFAWTSFGQDGSDPAGFGIHAKRFDAAGNGLGGGEFQVNTFTAGTQFHPAVAADADGDFLVAWQSNGQDGSGDGVYAKRFSTAGAELAAPAGAPLGQGNEFRANATTADAQRFAAVAVDADGDAVIAWQSYGQDAPSSWGVYAQRYGEPIPIPAPLVNNNDGATGTIRFTQADAVVVAFDDTVVVAFDDLGSSAGGAPHATGLSRSTDGGTTFFDGGTLPSGPGGESGFPSIARDDLTGRIYLATVGSNSPTIQVFRSDDDGVSWSLPVNGTPGAGGFQDKPDLAVDNFAGIGRGNVYLVSQCFGGATQGTRFHRSTDGGLTFGAGFQIVDDADFAAGPCVVVGPDHAVYVFWFQNAMLKLRKSTDLGVSFGPEVVVASGLAANIFGDLGLTGIRQGTAAPAAFRTLGFPQAAVNPVTGDLYVTFNNDAPGADKADVFLVQSTDGGAGWGAPLRVNDDTTATDQWNPTLAVLADGSGLGIFYYSRQEDPANNEYRYYGRQASTAGGSLAFAPSSPVSDVPSLPEFGRDPSANATYMNLYNTAFATDDAFHAVWSDSRDDLPGGAPRKDPNVYYERIPPDAVPARVAAVFVDGSAWTAAFRQHLADSGLGSAALGFRVDGGAAQLDELPWSNANRVHVVFSKDVNVDADDLALRGVNTASYPLDAAAFAYAAGTFTATWTLANNARFVNDKVLLDVNADAGGVTDKAAAGALDGEWANGSSAFPSGNAAAGGDFRFQMNFLPGDVNRNGGVVNSLDVQQVRIRQFLSPANPGVPPTTYTALYDVDGSAFINSIDVQQVRIRQFSGLPDGNPSLAAAAPARRAPAPFGATVIRSSWADVEREPEAPLV